jgi:hypothetical protein
LVEFGDRQERDDVHDDVDALLAWLDELLLCWFNRAARTR